MGKNINMKLTVAIPTHKMEGGPEFLRHSLKKLRQQRFKDFETVVSDNSDDDEIENVCKEFPELNILYQKYGVKGMAQNTNNAIRLAHSEIVKILYLDDFLLTEDALTEIVEAFTPEVKWLVTGCAHTIDGENYERPHYPSYNRDIHLGNNTIGSPSVLTIRKNGCLFFDEKLTWLLDCDLYRRYFDTYGYPKLVNSLGVIIRQGQHQVTHLLSDERKKEEEVYMSKKFK